MNSNAKFCSNCGSEKLVELSLYKLSDVDIKTQLTRAKNYYENKNYDKAFELLSKLSKIYNSEAQLLLGECYYCGNGVSQNYKEAIKWYSLSAEQNNDKALYQLGRCYYFGIGVDKNIEKARSFFEKSVKYGNTESLRFIKLLN
ncbi:MAG: sel1 repeat family protein [Clostridia bacterium]|nr:sel1 repeat family protein [Clostridia bacterium]